MAEYKVEFRTGAAKELRSLPVDTKRRIREAVDALSDEPRPGGVRKLESYRNLYRIRVGDYRVVYEIDDRDRLITIVRVRHRSEAYE